MLERETSVAHSVLKAVKVLAVSLKRVAAEWRAVRLRGGFGWVCPFLVVLFVLLSSVVARVVVLGAAVTSA